MRCAWLAACARRHLPGLGLIDRPPFPRSSKLPRHMQVRSLAPLSSLGSTQLTELFVACNKIAAIESLERLALLHTLELGGNRIRSLEGV